MKRPWENDSCEAIRAYFSYYTVPQAAALWCGVPPERLDEELRRAVSVGQSNALSRAVLRHPSIPCLEPRCRAIQDAINCNLLPVGRDGGKSFIQGHDHVAYERRTVMRADLKAWIEKAFPGDRPAFLFDEIERNTHAAINADTYRALKAAHDGLKVQLEKATESLRAATEERNAIKGERDSLKAMVEKMGAPGDRAEMTYLNIIGGLLGLMLGKTPAGKPQSAFENQAAIISAMLAHHEGKPGISARTLEEKFAAAKRSLSTT